MSYLTRDEALDRVALLEAKFAHYHMKRYEPNDDICKECALDLRDSIHLRGGETKELRLAAIEADEGEEDERVD